MSLRNLHKSDIDSERPNRGQWTKKEEAENIKEQAGMDIVVFQAELERCLARKEQLDQNMSTA